MNEPPSSALPEQHDTDPMAGLVEQICLIICEFAIVVMAVLVVSEIITRNLFGFSWELSDELGGYIIVGITFLSLCVCHTSGSYHHVEFVLVRLPHRARIMVRLLWDVMSLLFTIILIWQLARLELNSFASGDAAPTVLATPLWIPQATMVIGALALACALLRSMAGHVRALRGKSGLTG